MKSKLKLILSLLVSLALLNHCTLLQTLKDMLPYPQFSLDKIAFNGIDTKSIKLKLHAHISNPYPFDIPRAATNLKFQAAGRHFIDLKSDFTKGLPSRDNHPVEFDISLPFATLLSLYQSQSASAESADLIPLALAGDLDVYIPYDKLPEAQRKALEQFGKKRESAAGKIGQKDLGKDALQKYSFDVDLEEEVPAVFPDIEIRNFELERPSLSDIQLKSGGKGSTVNSYLNRLLGAGYSPGSAKGAGISGIDLEIKANFEIVLSNQAKAALDLADLNYDLRMAGQRMFRGKIQESEQLEDGSSVAKIQTGFPLRSITSAVASAIDRKSAPIQLLGNAALQLPEHSEFGKLNFRFDDSSQLRW